MLPLVDQKTINSCRSLKVCTAAELWKTQDRGFLSFVFSFSMKKGISSGDTSWSLAFNVASSTDQEGIGRGYCTIFTFEQLKVVCTLQICVRSLYVTTKQSTLEATVKQKIIWRS